MISGELEIKSGGAEAVFSLKEQGFEELNKLAVITPFLHQEKNWNRKKQESGITPFCTMGGRCKLRQQKTLYESLAIPSKEQVFIEKSDLLASFG